MNKNQKRNGTASSVPAGIIWGLVISLSIILLGSAAIAKMLDMLTVQWEMVGYWIMVLLLIASFSGAVTACTMIKRKRLHMSILYAGVLWVTLMVLTAIFFGGQYSGAGVTAGLILSGSICAGLLVANRTNGRVKKKRGYKRS